MIIRDSFDNKGLIIAYVMIDVGQDLLRQHLTNILKGGWVNFLVDVMLIARPGSKRSIFQTSFLGLLRVPIHSNEVAKGQIAQNMMKIGLKGPYIC